MPCFEPLVLDWPCLIFFFSASVSFGAIPNLSSRAVSKEYYPPHFIGSTMVEDSFMCCTKNSTCWLMTTVVTNVMLQRPTLYKYVSQVFIAGVRWFLHYHGWLPRENLDGAVDGASVIKYTSFFTGLLVDAVVLCGDRLRAHSLLVRFFKWVPRAAFGCWRPHVLRLARSVWFPHGQVPVCVRFVSRGARDARPVARRRVAVVSRAPSARERQCGAP